MRPKPVKFIIRAFKKARTKKYSDIEVDAFYLGNGVYLHKEYEFDTDLDWVLSALCGLYIIKLRCSKRMAIKIGKELTVLDWTEIKEPRPEYKELVHKIRAKYDKYWF